MSTTTSSPSQISNKKRNRSTLSCTECHRRKQKCDRSQPCRDCIQRGLPHRCSYTKPIIPIPETEPIPSAKSAKSRLRRIQTGEEVILSIESIDSLAGTEVVDSIPIWDSPVRARFGKTATYPSIKTGLMAPVARGTFPVGLTAMENGGGTGVQFRFLGGFDPFECLPCCKEAPVPAKLLVHYYLARLAPWLTYLDDEYTHNPSTPQTAWMSFAIHHMPLFYATLLTAVVHLNRRRPLKDPSAMIWFKVQTMRLANEKMNDPAQACTDEMLVVALVLCYFNVTGGNTREYEIHLKGINDMVRLRGGKEKLGMRGMVRNWLDVCHGPWSKDWEYGHFLYDD